MSAKQIFPSQICDALNAEISISTSRLLGQYDITMNEMLYRYDMPGRGSVAFKVPCEDLLGLHFADFYQKHLTNVIQEALDLCLEPSPA